MLTFSARLSRRRAQWWAPPRPNARTLRDALHRSREQQVLRGREDSDVAWRCCSAWPRTLLTKPNGREFAARHGCPLPELYWWGPDLALAPLEGLEGNYVVRPFTGSSGKGVLVVSGERDIMRDESASPDEVRARFSRRRWSTRRVPILVEERVRPLDAERFLPVEYKVHAFGETLAAVQRISRFDVRRATHRFYTPAWKPIDDQMNVYLAQEPVTKAPPELPEMLSLAATIGTAIGTYMRIDFFVGTRGLVFNEFSSTPAGGAGFTPYCDELFGRLWAAALGDAI